MENETELSSPEEISSEEDVEFGENEMEEVIPFQYSITSYGADYPVDGLVRRIKDGDIFIPSFQRGFVWTWKQASRFIESLLLGLPVPGIFMSKEKESQKLLVIDGQQRLRTLQYFYRGIFADTGNEFALKSVQKQFEGATYGSLADENRRRLDDAILHATIVKQDEPSDDESSIYQIFERLNTGGTFLTSQEIRVCIYHGAFNDLLKELNNNPAWRKIFGPIHKKMRDQELILRFLALYFKGHNYLKPMKKFLNDYMGENRNLTYQSAEQIRKAFLPTVEVIQKYIGGKAFRPKSTLNAALYDAIMMGIAKRLEKGKIQNIGILKEKYHELIANPEFLAAIETATTDKTNLDSRIKSATDIFTGVE
jgi:hypothetical protein